MDLPYRVEYAKSGRASCKGCKSPIAKDSVRLAVLVQSAFFDGKQANWYHSECFFKKQKPKTTDDIEHFESLRWEDQQQIKEKIQSCGGAAVVVPDSKKKGKKRDAAETAAKKAALADFKIEYAVSSRSTCNGCEQKIMKEEIRVSKKDYESDKAKRFGGFDAWHHLTCFANLRSELGYFEGADKLPGFKQLKKEDQKEAKKQIPAIKQEEVPEVKKIKTDPEVDTLDQKMKEQNQIIYKYRDRLRESLTKPQLIQLLTFNDQEIPSGEDRILDRLSDIMTFGALVPCEVCKGGQYVYNKFGYICQGDVTEWTKCENIEKKPKRRAFKVPPELAEEFSFLKRYKYVKRDRVFKEVNPSAAVAKKEKDDPDGAGPKIKREAPPLYNMEFVILGYVKDEKEELKEKIKKLGGKVVTKISRSNMAVIARESDVENMGSRMEQTRVEDVHVVSKDFVDEAKDNVGKIPDLVVKKSICQWGSNPTLRLPPESSKSGQSKSRSMFTSKVPSKQLLKLKGGIAVDPESGVDHKSHVYKKDTDVYSVVLSKTDIQKQQNSYYKLQLLQSDSGSRYWVFRSWGRIGTTIGGKKLEEFSTVNEALRDFKNLYEEKTGNVWEERAYFQKIPGRFYPVEVDYGEDLAKLEISDKPSKLAQPVQDLIRLIFNVNFMKKTMLEFELDTEKMPLGKLSSGQIQKAYGVLAELQKLIKEEKPQQFLVDACNRFYTLIPHSFGVDDVPIIKDEETIKQKLEMLESLMEMEVAYKMMTSVGDQNDIDHYYAKLNADIDALDHTTDDFKMIEEYVRNTHAKTHSEYDLEIVDVLRVRRHHEDLRYKPFKKLPNRKLLWHGSRLTNFAGILSQGLRIAPREAPSTGYMFGKGVYFADMVSKSANYCCTNVRRPTGLLLLCEVALGNMHECTQAEYIEKLPKGKHSTKGVGRTYPDPAKSKVVEDGVEVPLGTPIENKDVSSALLYNEFIVYDVAQVHAKYLLKVNFKYKY